MAKRTFYATILQIYRTMDQTCIARFFRSFIMTVAFYFVLFFSNSDDSIAKQLRQTFMENLLGTYRELERSFMENIYELQKAFGFQTLWKLDDVISSFRRIASGSSFGTGRLNGAVELQNVLTRVQRIKSKAKRCLLV